jgi:hypothetical protein
MMKAVIEFLGPRGADSYTSCLFILLSEPSTLLAGIDNLFGCEAARWTRSLTDTVGLPQGRAYFPVYWDSWLTRLVAADAARPGFSPHGRS